MNIWKKSSLYVIHLVIAEINESLSRLGCVKKRSNRNFQMHPTKALEPDGMTPGFCQKHWSIVGDGVCKGIRYVLQSACILRKINFMHITLIPKIKDPTEMTHLRPTSLCNVLYKIAAKVLANRLKYVLPHTISPMHSAFIPGRLISDNSLVAAEVVHFMHKRSSGWNNVMALKLDISKAYDCIEWNCLEAIKRK